MHSEDASLYFGRRWERAVAWRSSFIGRPCPMERLLVGHSLWFCCHPSVPFLNCRELKPGLFVFYWTETKALIHGEHTEHLWVRVPLTFCGGIILSRKYLPPLCAVGVGVWLWRIHLCGISSSRPSVTMGTATVPVVNGEALHGNLWVGPWGELDSLLC